MFMKLKSLPEDFEVEELSDFPFDGGQFAVYLLTKRSIGTPEAITAVSERWNIPRRAIGYGGLKDKHAVTRQWVTIQRGPRRDFRQDNLSLTYQGQASRHFGPQDISANRFHIVMRNLSEETARQILAERELLAQFGIPNYYDDQRFGSIGESGEFIARPWCRGDYERALWLAIAEPNSHDRPNDRDEKEIIRHCWGNWDECKAGLKKSSRRSIITYLVDHPVRFREAFALLRQDMRSLWLAAFQSDLWNRCLATTLREQINEARLWSVPLATTDVCFYKNLTETEFQGLAEVLLPLPSARLHLPEGTLLDLYERVIGEQGLALRELRVKYPRDSFFSKGERSAIIKPSQLRIDHSGADELNAGRQRLTLQFVLPRGSYATILIKRLTLPPLATP
jgi:tRNA pseudouridine13 synthase